MYDGSDVRYSGRGRYFIIPQDPQDREILEAIDNRTRVEADFKWGFIMDYTWQANTVANTLLEIIIKNLNLKLKESGSDTPLGYAFFDLFAVVVSMKSNERAEKEGNINVLFEPGSRVMDLIKNGPPEPYSGKRISPAEVFLDSENEAAGRDVQNIDYHARYELGISHGIRVRDEPPLIATAIAYSFFESLFIELLVRVSQGDPLGEGETRLVSVNFNDLVEVHAILDHDGGVKIRMRPGMQAKLLIKNDEVTEDTMGGMI